MQNSSVSYEFDVNLNMKVLYSKVSHSNFISCEIFFEYLFKKKIVKRKIVIIEDI